MSSAGTTDGTLVTLNYTEKRRRELLVPLVSYSIEVFKPLHPDANTYRTHLFAT